jgi:hypothetical protein
MTAQEYTSRRRWDSARKKVWEAVYVLVGEGTVRERLGYAYGLLAQLQPDEDLPAEVRPQFEKLMKHLRDRANEGTHGPVLTIANAPRSRKLAEDILSIYVALNDGI